MQFCGHLAPPPLRTNDASEGNEFFLAGGTCGSYSRISKV